MYLGLLVVNSSTVGVCFVSSPDYLQMSLLMPSRWLLSHFTEPASDKPPGCSPSLCGEVTPLRLDVQRALTLPSIGAVISV